MCRRRCRYIIILLIVDDDVCFERIIHRNA